MFRIRPSFFLFGSNHRLSNGAVRFVTRRMAWVMVAATMVLALAAGTAIGVALSGREGVDLPLSLTLPAPTPGQEAERAYMLGQLGKLQTSVAQIDPRVLRLAAQVAELRDFESRLKAPKTSQRSPSSEKTDRRPSLDGAGGPALPPKPCSKTRGWTTRAAGIDSTQQQLDCLDKTLSQLEREVTGHQAALAALPGRLPLMDSHHRFSSSFGNRPDPFDGSLKFHSGVDLAAEAGTPIHATAAGRVTFAGQKPGYGLTVEIDHGNQLTTRYAHTSRINVREGDLILPLEYIADVGTTGRSTRPHLHFEVLQKGEQIDPMDFLHLFSGGVDG